MSTGVPPQAPDARDADARALQAVRLLGRWHLVSQKHGKGCSCCPGLGNVDMAGVERHILGGLRMRHPMLVGQDSLLNWLREVARRDARWHARTVELDAALDGVDEVFFQLELAQAGMA